MSAKAKPIDRLMEAMDECARARGEPNYTMGYRAAKGEPEESLLYDKEKRQWQYCDLVEKRFRRKALRILREARND